jgi:hypothetical protein
MAQTWDQYAQSNSLGQSGNSEAEQTISQSQASAQDSQCVSGDITALSCNNLSLQLQRNGDDDGKKPPVPPGDKCPTDYVWDVTTTEDGTVPEGTVICLTQGLGNHPATVVEPGQEPYVTDVNANQPNDDPNCNGQGQQSAEVTSGTPPTPLEMGDPLCVKVTPVD